MSAVPKIQRILFATDFSEPAEHAQQYACELADKLQAELHLLHVHVPVIVPASLAPPSAAPSALLALESFGNSALGLLDRGVLGRLAAAS